jgi:hypothetical protein
MSEFDRREDGFENFFALEETLRFKALSRRNRALGRWAAELLGLTRDAAAAYVETLARAQVEAPDDERLFETLREDFAKAKVELSDHRIRRRMESALAEAVAEVQAGR